MAAMNCSPAMTGTVQPAGISCRSPACPWCWSRLLEGVVRRVGLLAEPAGPAQGLFLERNDLAGPDLLDLVLAGAAAECARLSDPGQGLFSSAHWRVSVSPGYDEDADAGRLLVRSTVYGLAGRVVAGPGPIERPSGWSMRFFAAGVRKDALESLCYCAMYPLPLIFGDVSRAAAALAARSGLRLAHFVGGYRKKKKKKGDDDEGGCA
jgi:hypothetical protein